MSDADAPMLQSWLANLTLVVHLLFVLFVVFGGLLLLRWPRLAWLHLPAALWGAWVELAVRVCPLTPLENRLLAAASRQGYEGGFLERYLLGALYPDGLSRADHTMLGLAALLLNLVIYGVVTWRWRRTNRQD